MKEEEEEERIQKRQGRRKGGGGEKGTGKEWRKEEGKKGRKEGRGGRDEGRTGGRRREGGERGKKEGGKVVEMEDYSEGGGEPERKGEETRKQARVEGKEKIREGKGIWEGGYA